MVEVKERKRPVLRARGSPRRRAAHVPLFITFMFVRPYPYYLSSTCYRLGISNGTLICVLSGFCVIYVCDIDQVPDFNSMYELYDRTTVMFFFRNKHIMIDLGTGNNNKINWALEDKQELIDIIETVYRGAKKGRGLVVSPKDYSTRYRY